ncbi:MAG: hypothetical protein ACU0A8_08835 [Limimaricola soesokkakensis]|uniref:hypothetical protein n=1 Tax=Limimaricola soesokkakensis TaxID=1343159 RepID=UPI004059C7C4
MQDIGYLQYVSLLGGAVLIALGAYLRYADMKVRSNYFIALRDRLEAYAQMKGEGFQEFGPGLMLTTGQHEVLLGILKKVEAKNAALTTFWVFGLGSLLSFSVSNGTILNRNPGFAISLSVLFFPFLVASIAGMKQLDQFHLWRLRSDKLQGGEGLSMRMQMALMLDLRSKELLYRASHLAAMTFALMASVFFMLFMFVGYWEVGGEAVKEDVTYSSLGNAASYNFRCCTADGKYWLVNKARTP